VGPRPFAVATVVVVSMSVAGLACRDNPGVSRDGGTDGVKADAPTALTVDIAVTGCASYDASSHLCTGRPPLALSFSPVGSPELTQFKWDFGDGTPASTERAPAHAYAHPDTYDVVLRSGAAGIGSVMASPLTIDVQPLAAGAPCDVDDQCGTGLTCLCEPGSRCAAAFIRGVCSMTCDETTACAPAATCASVAVFPQNVSAAPAALCLAACDTNMDCSAGFVCQTLTAALGTTPATRWTQACLPLGLVSDLGGSCRNADDVLVDGACATGSCADLGALGVCTAGCSDTAPCPTESACAPLLDGTQRCLATCQSDADCARDPLLACIALLAPNDAAPNTSVCAPRPCGSDATCAPSGHCGPDAVCVRGPR
jgi:PKD repeat protein